AARFQGDVIAVASSSSSVTWRSFRDQVARLAGGLRARGLVPGDRVAILAENSAAYLQLYMAVPWAGLVMVPLNTRWAERELVEAIADCGAKILIADEPFAARAQAVCDQLESPCEVIHASAERIDALHDAAPIADAELADDAT